MKKKPKTVSISVMLPVKVINRLKKVAKLAGVTMNEAAMVIIALKVTE